MVARAGTINGLIANARMTRHQPTLKFIRAQLEQLFNLNTGIPLLNWKTVCIESSYCYRS